MRKQPKAKSNRSSTAAPAGKKFPVGMAVFIVLAAVVILGLWLNRSKLADTLNPAQSAEPKIQQGTTAGGTPAAEPGFQKLPGRWLRPDGGYILEIKGVDTSGKMEAAYFNPRPIHVARAEAMKSGTGTKVFIELRDLNYPGSTYTLGYNPVEDRLEGIYFQAAMQQTFEVQFVRLRP
jgi:hypothetical protein